MVNLLFRLISLIGLCFFGLIIFLVGQSPLNEGKHLIKPYIDTQFPEKFKIENLQDIKIGMKVDQVEKILGKPLYVAETNLEAKTKVYRYSSDGKSKIGDFAWYNVSVTFDAAEKLVQIDNGWIED